MFSFRSLFASKGTPVRKKSPTARPRFELLEDRTAPAILFSALPKLTVTEHMLASRTIEAGSANEKIDVVTVTNTSYVSGTLTGMTLVRKAGSVALDNVSKLTAILDVNKDGKWTSVDRVLGTAAPVGSVVRMQFSSRVVVGSWKSATIMVVGNFAEDLDAGRIALGLSRITAVASATNRSLPQGNVRYQLRSNWFSLQPAQCDLSVSLDGSEVVAAGRTATYHITVVNESGTARNAAVSIVLPEGMTFEAAQSDNRFQPDGSGQLIASLGDLPVGSRTLDLTLSATMPGVTDLTAFVGSDTVDVNGDNDVAFMSIAITDAPAMLFVTQDAVPLSHQFLLGGSVTPVGRISFTALHELVNVSKLQLSILGDAQSVDRLELLFPGQADPFAYATVGMNETDIVPTSYNGSPVTTMTARMQNALIVPQGQTVTAIVAARIKTDVDGGRSGQPIQLLLIAEPVVDDVTGRGTVHGWGMDSSNALAGDDIVIGGSTPGPDATIVFPEFTTVMSTIAGISNANPDADGSGIPLGVADLGQFKFSAAANENSKNGLDKVVLESLSFLVSVANTEVDLQSFRLFNKADSTLKVAPSSVMLVSEGLYQVTFTNLDSIDNVIGSGQNQTYVLRADVLNPKIDASKSSSLRVGLKTDVLGWRDTDGSTNVLFNGTDLLDPVVWSTLYKD